MTNKTSKERQIEALAKAAAQNEKDGHDSSAIYAIIAKLTKQLKNNN